MRYLIVTAVLAVLLSACGGSTATGQVSSNEPRATPTPGPILLDVSGSAKDHTTRAFTAQSSWQAHYSFQCLSVNPRFGHAVLQIFGIDPKHPNGQETIILYALTTPPQVGTKGTSDPIDPGSYRLRIVSDPVCSWHVVVRPV